jgi:multidrug transporter EmrE-like cation transporter
MLTPKTLFFILLGSAVILEVIGDVLFKKYALDSKKTLMIIGLIFYFLGSLLWAISLKYETLSKAGTIFMLANIILIVLVGTLYFNEELSFANKVGIALGALSIILIEL